MDKNEVLHIVVKHLQPCLDGNMQINDKAVEGIKNECKMNPACVEAMKKVVDWFNKKDLGLRCFAEQERHIGAAINMIALLAAGNIAELVEKWILFDME